MYFQQYKTKLQYLFTIYIFINPLIIFYICEYAYNPLIYNISWKYILLNYIIIFVLQSIALLLTKIKFYVFRILYLLAFLLGISNYYITLFRSGNSIMLVDLLSFQTAFSVIGNYHYQITEGMLKSFLIMLSGFIILSLLKITISSSSQNISYKKYNNKLTIVVLIIFFSGFFWITKTDFSSLYGIDCKNMWCPADTYNTYGFAASFITYYQRARVHKPGGYSGEKIANIFSKINRQKDMMATVSFKPYIIVIMNESFSNVEELGPINYLSDDLHNIFSLQNIEYGRDYVSIRGGGTCQTEFEFLTGNSTANLHGQVPFSQFNFENVPSIVMNLKKQGYMTIAMHPENPSNWKRNSVYKGLKFDHFISREDFNDAGLIRGWVSDLSDYQKLIHVFEQQKQPTFIFNVTMQNHGGYDIDSISKDIRVKVDERYSQYTDFQAYESLMHQSDLALKYLINYFRRSDKPVIICFFGDHQPDLDDKFEDTLIKSGQTRDDTGLSIREKYYAVPYFIWANYKLSAISSEKKTINGMNIISPNYLGAVLLKYAGLELSSFDKYLLWQRHKISAINALGFYGDDNKWHVLDEKSPVYGPLLQDYRYIQYNAMFDKQKDWKYYTVEAK